MPASRRALVVALACLSNFSLSCFAAAQLSDQVVRVTDSSPAADPVMGVNITLKTTLARVPENGMPVILGSSQAQVVGSGRPRLHRAVCRKRRPVRGVHHCECRAIDRAVSDGERSGDSFESGSKKLHPITPSASRGRQFGAQPVVSQSVPDMLFAVPQGDPGNEPAVDSNASACPKSVADDPCHDRRGPPAASPESEDSVPPTPARSKPAKAKPKAQKKVVPAESDVAGIAPSTDAKGKVRIQSQPRQAPRFPRTNEVARC